MKAHILHSMPVCVLVLSVYFLATSCTSRTMTVQIQKYDTLNTMMEDLDGALLLDEDAIAKRRDSITDRIQTILHAMPDSGATDVKFAIVRYAAMRASYDDVLKNYPVVSFDVDQEKERLKAFKQSIVNKELADKAFEIRFETERLRLLSLQQRVKTLNYNTGAIENDYRRNSDILKPVYDKIKGNRKP
jgi:hypothetical protein